MQVHAVDGSSHKSGEVAHKLGLAHAGVPVEGQRCVEAVGEGATVEERVVVEVETQRRHEICPTGEQRGRPAVQNQASLHALAFLVEERAGKEQPIVVDSVHMIVTSALRRHH